MREFALSRVRMFVSPRDIWVQSEESPFASRNSVEAGRSEDETLRQIII